MVNVLESIQLVAAEHWQRSKTKLSLLLTNKTGYSRLAISGPPFDIIGGLLPLLETAVDCATTVVEISVCVADNKLIIAVQPDDLTPSSAAFEWGESALMTKPTPPILVGSQTLTPITDDSSLVYELSALAMRLNLFSLLPGAGKEHSTKATPTFILYDCRRNPEIVNSARHQGKEHRSICLYNIDQLQIATLHDGILLFWPCFDNDLICLLHRFQRKLMVLLADDSKPSQFTTQAMLEGLGCHVICADDGKQALTIAENKRFDLIFLDELMPHIHGSEAARQLSRPGSINLTTDKISLTGVNEQGAIDNLSAAGITQHVEKPVNKSSLESFLFTWRQDHTS